MVDVSFVIPTVHDFPQLIMTVLSLQNEMVDGNFSWEIIIAENRERDAYSDKFLHTFRYLRKLGVLKYCFEPRPCGPIARNTGAKHATGKYLIFLDGHQILGKNTVPIIVNTIEEKRLAGIVHGCTGYSHYDPKNFGCHYKLFGGGGPQLTTHMHGTYQRCRELKEPYLVANATGAYICFRREEFLRIRGYHEACRYYPHPEGYIDLKYWMFGMEVWLDPRCWHFHSLLPRNYGPPPTDMPWHDHSIRNAMICAYTLGGLQWINKVWEAWREKGGKPFILDKLRESAIISAESEYEWVQTHKERSLNETLLYLQKLNVKGTEKLPEWIS